MKWFLRLFIKSVRLLVIDEAGERKVLNEMRKIEGIKEYLEMQRQAGFYLFAKTRNERHLGTVDFAETLLRIFEEMEQPAEITEAPSSGYESTQ